MELTIEQALQQGITAHKEGKLEEAERLYRAILLSQPAHADANHNLGVIAVSVNKAEAALPLFKTAVEANPKIEQFWLSYIDALIKEKQFDNAKVILEQAKKKGLSGEKLYALETQLTPITQVNEPKLVVQKKSLTLSKKRKKLAENKKKKGGKQNLKGISPSEAEVNNLLQHYQTGRYDDAEQLALSITERFPEHQFGWKVLGALLKQSGRITESLTSMQKSVQLAPQDAEAQSNLGVTLQELGRLEEAEASHTQAIGSRPDYAEAHVNLGVTLQELGRLEEAEASFRQAIALKPDYADAHYNLGNILHELGRLDEAEESFRQMILLKPDFALAHYNLGATLKQLGKLDEAEASFRQAIALKPDYALAHSKLCRVLYQLGDKDSALESIQNANEIDPASKSYGLILSVIKSRESHWGGEAAVGDTLDIGSFTGLTSNPLTLHREVEAGLIASLYGMRYSEIDKTKRQGLLASGKSDARYGNGKCSPDFNFLGDTSSIIQKLSKDLTIIMMEAVKSDIYIYESFFNILRAGGGLTPHTHINNLDKELDLEKQKYSLVYYLSVGDQNCSQPGILRLYEPNEDILPCEGMMIIFPSNRKHSAFYGGETDRVMIGINFYSL